LNGSLHAERHEDMKRRCADLGEKPSRERGAREAGDLRKRMFTNRCNAISCDSSQC
jgi:hypothetical protein